MTRFVEQALARAGLSPVLPARRRGDLDSVRALLASLGEIDLLALGAAADAVRAEENGDVVRIHPAPSSDVSWIAPASTELDLLRARARARARVARPVTETFDEIEETTVRRIDREVLGRLEAAAAALR